MVALFRDVPLLRCCSVDILGCSVVPLLFRCSVVFPLFCVPAFLVLWHAGNNGSDKPVFWHILWSMVKRLMVLKIDNYQDKWQQMKNLWGNCHVAFGKLLEDLLVIKVFVIADVVITFTIAINVCEHDIFLNICFPQAFLAVFIWGVCPS